MATAAEIKKDVLAILRTEWKRREGQKVPEAEDVGLGNDAVCLKGAVLYADLAESTELVAGYKDWFAAEVYKAYLLSACRAIRDEGGEITAFDGDRVMAVYIGDSKNSAAARTALKINYIVRQVVNPAIKEVYASTAYELSQAVGIDTSDLFVARTGVRGSNDLVWVGRSANYAAKLCGLREGNYSSYITEAVFNSLNDAAKYGGAQKQCMWEKVIWEETGMAIYRSSWWWKVD